MPYQQIFAAIDAELTRLNEARSLLTGLPDALKVVGKQRGRPKGSKNADKAAAETPAKAPAKGKRVMSAEARQRIGDAQRKRHAAKKEAPAEAGA